MAGDGETHSPVGAGSPSRPEQKPLLSPSRDTCGHQRPSQTTPPPAVPTLACSAPISEPRRPIHAAPAPGWAGTHRVPPEGAQTGNRSPDSSREPGQVMSRCPPHACRLLCLHSLTEILEGGYSPALTGEGTRSRGHVTCGARAAGQQGWARDQAPAGREWGRSLGHCYRWPVA